MPEPALVLYFIFWLRDDVNYWFGQDKWFKRTNECEDTVLEVALLLTSAGSFADSRGSFNCSALRWNINSTNQISSILFPCIGSNSVCVSQQALCMCQCVRVRCVCHLSTGGIKTLHIKQPGIAVLSDVIESNEIHQVLKLWCCVERWVCVCVVGIERETKKDKEAKHPESVYKPETGFLLYFNYTVETLSSRQADTK